MFGFSRPQLIAFLAMVALIVICPFILYPVFLMRVLTTALFACAFNLMIGYVGLLSFGQAAFYGMGAYVSAWTIKNWHVDASIAIALGGLTGGVLGLALGYLAIRRSGIYFAMITLALAQMVYFFCLEAPFTGGEDGIQQVPRGFLLGFIDLSKDMTMYWLVAAVFGLVHGLGFAGGLIELGLPRDAMVRALIGFNVGVELGQLAFVAAVMPVVVWLAKPGRVPFLPQALSVAVAATGAFWLIERLFFV